ncbi:MAG: sodium:alanine symporter family protein [Roseburia sp.]|nr:sodium:alanine symporter family protein [Roseburia sp.]
MRLLEEWINRLDEIVWGPGLLCLMLGTGIYLMLRLRFLPVRELKRALGYVFGGQTNHSGEGVSPLSALTTELAATIGTGNIVGVATAMVLGGPGALFWMMVSSLLGMSTKLVESMLSVKYREKNDKGEAAGGPMYTLRAAFPLKKIGAKLGVIYAFFAVLASFGMGNMVQSNSIAAALHTSFHWDVRKIGMVLCIVTILVVLGGVKSVTRVTGILVPFMGLFYLMGCSWVILIHLDKLPFALIGILEAAFAPQALRGGLFGSVTVSVMQSLRWGVSRGVFSNEAGLGAAGISAAAAHTDDPVRQGYISMTGVFLDTMVICLISGLTLAVSGVLGGGSAEGMGADGTAMIIAAFEGSLGGFGSTFVSISITLFAFATIIGWAYQGEKAFEFIAGGSGKCIWYRMIYGLTTFVGAVCSLQLVWNFSDICNGLMAIPNLLCVLVLSGEACREILRYKPI